MDIRPLSPRYAVSPQITTQDLAAIAAAGYSTVICNRPDVEVTPDIQSGAIESAARDAGLTFHVLPLTHQTMTPENVAKQADIVDGSAGPVLAYCASGTRCSVIWSLMQANTLPVDEILGATANAGYDLSGLRPMLEQAARQ